jgi:hypothetical protein
MGGGGRSRHIGFGVLGLAAAWLTFIVFVSFFYDVDCELRV